MSSQTTYPDFVQFGNFFIRRREFRRVSYGCICFNNEDFKLTMVLEAGKLDEIVETNVPQSEVQSIIGNIDKSIASFNEYIGDEHFIHIAGGLFFSKAWIQENGIPLHNLSELLPSSESGIEPPGSLVFTLKHLPSQCGKVLVYNDDPKGFNETVSNILNKYHPDWIVAGKSRFIANSKEWFAGIRMIDRTIVRGRDVHVICVITDGMNDTITLKTTMEDFRIFNTELDAAIVEADVGSD